MFDESLSEMITTTPNSTKKHQILLNSVEIWYEIVDKYLWNTISY